MSLFSLAFAQHYFSIIHDDRKTIFLIFCKDNSNAWLRTKEWIYKSIFYVYATTSLALTSGQRSFPLMYTMRSYLFFYIAPKSLIHDSCFRGYIRCAIKPITRHKTLSTSAFFIRYL